MIADRPAAGYQSSIERAQVTGPLNIPAKSWDTLSLREHLPPGCGPDQEGVCDARDPTPGPRGCQVGGDPGLTTRRTAPDRYARPGRQCERARAGDVRDAGRAARWPSADGAGTRF